MAKRRRWWTLQDLEPEWTQLEGEQSWRYNVGFSMDCPFHGTHRLVLRFTNPYDGFEFVDGPGVLVRMVENGSFDQLTLATPDGRETIDFEPCGRLRIIEGKVEIVR